jgi:hypothetical protein
VLFAFTSLYVQVVWLNVRIFGTGLSPISSSALGEELSSVEDFMVTQPLVISALTYF